MKLKNYLILFILINALALLTNLSLAIMNLTSQPAKNYLLIDKEPSCGLFLDQGEECRFLIGKVNKDNSTTLYWSDAVVSNDLWPKNTKKDDTPPKQENPFAKFDNLDDGKPSLKTGPSRFQWELNKLWD